MLTLSITKHHDLDHRFKYFTKEWKNEDNITIFKYYSVFKTWKFMHPESRLFRKPTRGIYYSKLQHEILQFLGDHRVIDLS